MAHADQQLAEALAGAVDDIAAALAALGDAYEQLDDASADRLEEELFGPAQQALARARRAYSLLAGRAGLPAREFGTPGAGAPSHGVKGFLERAINAVAQADATLADLLDTMVEIELNDPQLRAALAETRTALDGFTGRARRFVSGFGR